MIERDARVDAVAAVQSYVQCDPQAACEILNDARCEGIEAVEQLARQLVLVAGFALRGWERADPRGADRSMASLGSLLSIGSDALS